jgi:hypothetical protein
MAARAPSSSAPASGISLAVVVRAGAPPPSDESARETLVWCLDSGGGNSKERLSLASNCTGKASIYRGIQCTCSQGILQENPSSNRLKIMTLEIGFERGSK